MPKRMPMRTARLAAATVLIAFVSLQKPNHAEEKKAMNTNVKRITPVLFVKEIEPVLPFWVEKLGFTKTIEVPQGNRIGFAALQKGQSFTMYQRGISVAEDTSLIAELLT